MEKKAIKPIPFAIPVFQQKLLDWFKLHQRDLPWRKTTEPYPVWVSEVMLQQTQVATVVPYFERFMATFPTVNHLAEAPLQTVLKVWEGLGYYARARNLHRAALWIVTERGGQFPTTFKEWKQLPGVGDYIAAAISSIVFGEVVPVVDGNVKRVLSRLLTVELPVNTPAAMPHFRQYAGLLIAPQLPGDFNQAMMELGATICTPRQPACKRCPIAQFCEAYTTGTQSEYPKRVRRAPIPTRRVAIGVIIFQGKVLITRRKTNALLGGLWEFPGGKIEDGETPQQACLREIYEETGLTVTIERQLAQVKHAYTHFRVELTVFICHAPHTHVTLNGAEAYRWVTPAELSQFPFPGANRKFFPQLAAYFQQLP